MIPENPEHRTEAVMATHRYVEENPLDTTARLIHADTLDDAGASREAVLQRHVAQPQGRISLDPDMTEHLRREARHATGLASLASCDLDRRMMFSTERPAASGRASTALFGSMYATSAMEHGTAAKFHEDRAAGRVRHGRTNAPISAGQRKQHREAAAAHRVAEMYHSALAKVRQEGER